MSSNYRRSRETKGHGCLGFFLTLILIIAIVGGAIFFFTGGAMNGVKGRVYKYFYPQKYSEQVTRYSSEFGVDEALIYSVIRTARLYRDP